MITLLNMRYWFKEYISRLLTNSGDYPNNYTISWCYELPPVETVTFLKFYPTVTLSPNSDRLEVIFF